MQPGDVRAGTLEALRPAGGHVPGPSLRLHPLLEAGAGLRLGGPLPADLVNDEHRTLAGMRLLDRMSVKLLGLAAVELPGGGHLPILARLETGVGQQVLLAPGQAADK